MTDLVVIRHGQASFMADDYDVLSKTGIRQSERLGAYIAARGWRVDRVVTGPLRRQRDTAAHLCHVAAGAGAALPEPDVHPGLEEYPAFGIVSRCLPDLIERDEVVKAGLALDGTPTDPVAYARAIKQVMMCWARDELDIGELESFAAFRDRVQGAVEDVLGRAGARDRVLIVTSGGPVATSMQQALGLSDEMTVHLAWTVVNASFTWFRYRPRSLRLFRFNAIPHLEEDDLVTFR